MGEVPVYREEAGTACVPRRRRFPGGFGVYGLGRFRENMAHIRQSRPDSGLGFKVKVVEIF